MNPALEETIYVCFDAQNISGTPVNADSLPAAQVYENGVSLALTLTVTNITTGFYQVAIPCTAATGFEAGKSYSLRVTATISGVSTAGTPETWQMRTGSVDAVNVTKLNGTSTGGTGTRVADTFVSFFNVLAATGNANSLPAAIPGAADGLVISGANADINFASMLITSLGISTDLSITGNVTVGGNFGITGQFNAGQVAFTSLEILGGFTVDGTITFSGPIIAIHPDNDIEGVVIAQGTIDNLTFAAGAIDAAATSADFVTEIGTAIWTDLLASTDFSTALSIGKLLKDNINATIASRSTLTASDVDTQLSGTHGAGQWGSGASGGAHAITIKMTSDGVTAIQGASVAVYNGNILIGSSATDVSGNTSGISADNGTYDVTATATGYQNFSAQITVSGAGSFTETMTAVAPITPPSAPSLCRIAGYIYDSTGTAVEGVHLTALLRPLNNVTSPIVSGNAVVTLDAVSDASDSNGYAEIEVYRTDALSLPCTYTITTTNGQVNRDGVTLISATLNLNTL